MSFVKCSVDGCNRKLSLFEGRPQDRDTWLYRECDLCLKPACEKHSAEVGVGSSVTAAEGSRCPTAVSGAYRPRFPAVFRTGIDCRLRSAVDSDTATNASPARTLISSAGPPSRHRPRLQLPAAAGARQCGVHFEDRYPLASRDAFEMKAGDGPVLGKAEGEPEVMVKRQHPTPFPPYPHVSILVNLDVNDVRAAADRAILDVLLA